MWDWLRFVWQSIRDDNFLDVWFCARGAAVQKLVVRLLLDGKSAHNMCAAREVPMCGCGGKLLCSNRLEVFGMLVLKTDGL